MVSWRSDPGVRPLADRHYNRQRIGADNFVPPGRCFVLRTPSADAFWVTSWPFAEYVHHAWAGAWICSTFRREGGEVPASEMIRQAVAATRYRYGEPPALGMVTFVDPLHVRPTMVRGSPVYGWTYRRAGFVEVGRTKERGLIALRLPPSLMPEPEPAIGADRLLWENVA